MVYSAAVTKDPPAAASEPVACTATPTEPLAGLGDRLTPVVAGPTVSLEKRTDTSGPQLSNWSLPCT